MKKSLTIIALAALVMLAGCKKNEQTTGTKLTAGIEKHKSDSKTSLDGLQIKWSENDQLYVNNGTTSACFTLVSGAGTTKGEFATEGEYPFAAENNVAVYPYNNDITVSGTTVTMTLPAEQAASGAGSFGNGANPMLGTFSDMDNLTLTSLCGVLCLQLTGNDVNITAIEIVGGPDDKLNGTFTVDYMNPEPTYPTEGTNTVRLNCNATLTTTAQKFYVVVPAGTLHGLTMKVYNGNNEIFSKSTANNVPVYVNTLSTMDPVEVAHEYVDLGLPSGFLWATCNIGANAPEEYGDYFAWGETQMKTTYNWSTYQYCNGSQNTLTKYCNKANYGYNGFTDNLTTLQLSDDAARANWGGNWRMPTKEDFQELYNNTTVTYTQQGGVNGLLFTAANNNSLFLPAAGGRSGDEPYDAGDCGHYWSSSLNTGSPSEAWQFFFGFFGSDYFNVTCYNRDNGFTVRPVREN